MMDDLRAKLNALLEAYAERAEKATPAKAAARGEAQRRLCGDRLRAIARPLLEEVMALLRAAGHEAATRDHTERESAYPSVALSFTPKRSPAVGAALASALIFRFDPRYGVVAQSHVTPGSERLGTIGVDALSREWVQTKTLTFVEAVLKAN